MVSLVSGISQHKSGTNIIVGENAGNVQSSAIVES